MFKTLNKILKQSTYTVRSGKAYNSGIYGKQGSFTSILIRGIENGQDSPQQNMTMPHPSTYVRRGSISRDKDAGTNVTHTICPTKVVSKLVPPYNRVPGQTEQVFKLRSFHLKIASGFFFVQVEKRNAPEHHLLCSGKNHLSGPSQ